MKFKRFGALLASFVLCIVMRPPLLMVGVLPHLEETEPPVMVLRETEPLTPEGNSDPGRRLPHPLIPTAAGSSSSPLSASRQVMIDGKGAADRAFHEPGG